MDGVCCLLSCKSHGVACVRSHLPVVGTVGVRTQNNHGFSHTSLCRKAGQRLRLCPPLQHMHVDNAFFTHQMLRKPSRHHARHCMCSTAQSPMASLAQLSTATGYQHTQGTSTAQLASGTYTLARIYVASRSSMPHRHAPGDLPQASWQVCIAGLPHAPFLGCGPLAQLALLCYQPSCTHAPLTVRGPQHPSDIMEPCRTVAQLWAGTHGEERPGARGNHRNVPSTAPPLHAGHHFGGGRGGLDPAWHYGSFT